MSQPVHQIRYAWSESSLVDTRGMGPVESTLPDELLGTWESLLQDHVWAAAAEPGFTFLLRNGVGVLIKKEGTKGTGRRGSDARVLLSEQLTARDALGITAWKGWDDPEVRVLDWSAVEPAVHPGLEALRSRARALPPRRLASLLGQVMCLPGSSYTVIGEPDPLALVCALGDMLGETPSFASDEADDSRRELPTAVFMREVPVSSTIALRRRLDPAAAVSDPRIARFAEAVVDAYVTEGLDGIAAIQRDRAPADMDEVYAWAEHGQFAPGIVADLSRLPYLTRDVLESFTAPQALDRLAAAARSAPDSRLLRALDPGLPDALLASLVREALGRISHVSTDHALLDRVAGLGPLSLGLVKDAVSGGFGNVAAVSRSLLTPEDRRALLEEAAQDLPVSTLVGWIDEHASADPAGALAVLSALCTKARDASPEDIRALVTRKGLVDAIRRITDSPQQSSAYLASLLGALPKDALGRDAVIHLARYDDPVLLNALDTVLTAPALREVVHLQIRLAYYHANHLPAPPLPGAAPPAASGLISRLAPWKSK